MEKREIRAVYTEDTIRVYQAYPEIIAKEAVKLNTFGAHFKMNRMTWIKPSFLWMMYRCGWAEKENQECVLAIDIKRKAFNEIVKKCCVIHLSKRNGNYNRRMETAGETVGYY